MTDTEIAAHNLKELRKLQAAIAVVVDTLEIDRLEMIEKKKSLARHGNLAGSANARGQITGIDHALTVLSRAGLR